ncbi:MAG: hypothetical protein ACJAUL_003621, partial [Paraglaciecola sp.]
VLIITPVLFFSDPLRLWLIRLRLLYIATSWGYRP